MIPLYLADKNEDLVIRKISGGENLVRHIKELGIVVGSIIRIINDVNGNLIVQVKDSRLAISVEFAKRIYI